jgi:hypothetical protein
MALSFECERCGAAGSVRAEPGTPTLVKCTGCGHTFITGGPLGAPKIEGGVRAPAVPFSTPKATPIASTATPVGTPAPTPPPRPSTPARIVAPLDAPSGPDRWAKTEIEPDSVPPPDGGYVDFTLDDDPPVPPSVDPVSPAPAPRAPGRSAKTDTPPVPFPRREPTRELPRPGWTPPPVGASAPAPEPERELSRELRVPAFASVPRPPDRKWVPFAVVGAVGLLIGAIVAVVATRNSAPAAETAVTAAPALPTTPAPAAAQAQPDPAARPTPATPAPATVTGAVAAAEPKTAPERAATPPARAAPERRAPAAAPAPAPERAERTEHTVSRRAPAAEPNIVRVPTAPPPESAAVTAAVFSPPPTEPVAPAAPAAPVVEDAPVYASDGFRRPTAADPGCVQRSIRLPRDLQDRVPAIVPVRFAVAPDGGLSQFSVIADVPDRRVGESIWSAIRACKFNPGADARGRPVRLWVVMPIRFVGR